MFRKPMLVTQITLSNSMNMAGRNRITANILTIAPLAIRSQRELIMSTSEYRATPKVAENSHMALTIMEGMDTFRALVTASRLSLPS